MSRLSRKQIALKWLFYVIPHHALSRVIYFVTRLRGPQVKPLIAWFVERYGVNMDEAQQPDIGSYQTFNEFFTRALAAELRPIAAASVACPCDGTVSQAGSINDDSIMQAKQHEYSLLELLGGEESLATQFQSGQFVTIYLAPYNYHRLHMPLDGKLIRMIHIPGRLFSVAQWTVASIPRLFTRNERLVCHFETSVGAIVMVLVGAMNVAAIETVWSGLVVPPSGKNIRQFNYAQEDISLAKGAEMGRFNMGSTLILLTAKRIEWLAQLSAGQTVKMGQSIGRITD